MDQDDMGYSAIDSQVSGIREEKRQPGGPPPSGDEINESIREIQTRFPHLSIDKVVTMLYKSLIISKEQSKTPSVNSSHSHVAATVRPSQSTSQRARNSDVGISSFDSISMRGVNQPQQKEKGVRGRKKKDKKEEELKISEEVYNRYNRSGRDLSRIAKEFAGEHEQNLKKAKQWNMQQNTQHKLYANKVAPKFQSRDDEVKYYQKRIAAKSFCERGYGLHKVKEQLYENGGPVNLDKKRYKTVSTAFINESYRRLQNFLMEQCQRNIRPLTGPQMRAIYSLLLNAQSKFDQDEYLTFRKFIKVTFDLGSVSIFQQSAVKLYIKIQNSLRGRVGCMKLDRQHDPQFKGIKRQMIKSPGRYQNQRFQSESIWTAELEVELIESLTEHRTIARTRDALRLKYGDHIVLGNVKELKARLYKIIRIAVKRLQVYFTEYAHKVPSLVQLSDQKIKTIIRSPYALQARLALGKLYKTTSFNADILTQTINIVNQFCYLDEMQHQNNEKFKQPVITSVTDKIKHNVNVSRKLLKNVSTPAQRSGEVTDLVFMKSADNNYEHIVSLEHNDKLHYFRKVGELNSKGGYQYQQKPPDLKRLEMEDGDDDSSELINLSEQD